MKDIITNCTIRKGLKVDITYGMYIIITTVNLSVAGCSSSLQQPCLMILNSYSIECILSWATLKLTLWIIEIDYS